VNSILLALVTHGALVGEVTSTSAVLWARADRAGEMRVVVEPQDGGPALRFSTPVGREDDFTGKVALQGLRPSTAYAYRVGLGDDASGFSGVFRTAPAPEVRVPVRFVWGGDVGGQNACRDRVEGYPIFKTMRAVEKEIDFFIALGDMIYADNACEGKGRFGNSQVPNSGVATDLPSYWAQWKYNREDAAFQELFAATPYYAVWDDHEVVNDFGPLHDTRQEKPYSPAVHLLPIGREAFLDYNPLLPPPDNTDRLYRSISWGSAVEVFFLDNRQYRDPNRSPDLPSRPKTMLGREQLAWVRQGLGRSGAIWKVIVSSVPLSVPTGSPVEAGRDGWANFDQDTGFEQELFEILAFLRSSRIGNVVFITTDVHFAEVFRYRPFPDSPRFEVHEFISGPLNAGLFPNRDFDRSLNPESLFYYGPQSPEAVQSWEEAKRWFNYGAVDIDQRGALTVRIVNALGQVVYRNALLPEGVWR